VLLIRLRSTGFYWQDILLTFKDKLPIGGIKFSEERVHYTISRKHSTVTSINELLQRIHKKQINIPFLCHSSLADADKICFCVSTNDADSVTEIIKHSTDIKQDISTHHQVGSVTIFPHKKEITFIAIVMSLLESLPVPVYSSCTSISAYVFNTNMCDLQTIAKELTKVFKLPENHSPFYPEFQLRQPRSSIAP
jgi:hypothetical protein